MFVSPVRELLSAFRRNSTNRQLRQRRDSRRVLPSAAEYSLVAEQLEERILLSSFTVANLNDSGNGSLRQAITNANANAGADNIVFDVSGTIQLTSRWPFRTSPATSTSTVRPRPNYAGKPLRRYRLQWIRRIWKFDAGAAGSISSIRCRAHQRLGRRRHAQRRREIRRFPATTSVSNWMGRRRPATWATESKRSVRPTIRSELLEHYQRGNSDNGIQHRRGQHQPDRNELHRHRRHGTDRRRQW